MLEIFTEIVIIVVCSYSVVNVIKYWQSARLITIKECWSDV